MQADDLQKDFIGKIEAKSWRTAVIKVKNQLSLVRNWIKNKQIVSERNVHDVEIALQEHYIVNIFNVNQTVAVSHALTMTFH
ncbi:CLUMA_CG005023, isoform A [Clunio marinus]|uniref:CLUMA_CG005023, isoform A n=1 Tax=Clunio marinus TaxID=568069 RepID=A0A1J1HXV2_9DIPT|nr:CLUMA_CG005023, isoform A [Clunio marinus]